MVKKIPVLKVAQKNEASQKVLDQNPKETMPQGRFEGLREIPISLWERCLDSISPSDGPFALVILGIVSTGIYSVTRLPQNPVSLILFTGMTQGFLVGAMYVNGYCRNVEPSRSINKNCKK